MESESALMAMFVYTNKGFNVGSTLLSMYTFYISLYTLYSLWGEKISIFLCKKCLHAVFL